MPREFTDSELREIAEFVARRYLEVERGLRDKRDLRRFLSREAYELQRNEAASRYGSGGIVRQADLGQMIFQHFQPDRVHIAIPAREEGDRWGALVMEMCSDSRGVWRVTELTRAEDRNITQARTALRSPQPQDPDLAQHQLARTLQDARVARTTVGQRHASALRELAQLAPEKLPADLRRGDRIMLHGSGQDWFTLEQVAVDGSTGDVHLGLPNRVVVQVAGERPVRVLATVQDADRASAAAEALQAAADAIAGWDRQIAMLEAEHRQLSERRLSEELPDDRLGPEPPSYVTRMLGPAPTAGPARQVWSAAAEAIETYRSRWAIASLDSALGPPADDPQQREDRNATASTLRDLSRQLHDLEGLSDVGRGRVAALQQEGVGHGPFALSPPEGGR